MNSQLWLFCTSTSVGQEERNLSLSSNLSTAAVYALGDDGDLPGTEPLQQLHPTINQTGPVKDRQDRSYLHHVILDPTGEYILIPDLGGDLIRVFSYDNNTVAPITELSPLRAASGAGPRHGFFRQAADGETYFYFNGELNQRVYSYRVEYQESGLEFTKVFEVAALDDSLPAVTAPASEIALSVSRTPKVVSQSLTLGLLA